MKILFLLFEPMSKIASARELELLTHHIQKQDEIYYFYCKYGLPSCIANLNHTLSKCVKCIGYRKKNISFIANYNKLYSLIFNRKQAKFIEKKYNNIITKILNKVASAVNIDEIKKINFNGCNMGYESLSTLITATRNPDINISEYRNSIMSLIRSSLLIHFFLLELFNKKTFDVVYIDHGRRTPMRTAAETCKLLGVKFIIYESGSSINKYSLYENELVHTFGKAEERIIRFWNNSKLNNFEKIREGVNFFRSRDIEHQKNIFVINQKKGQLPNNLDKNKRNITFFLTSDDEYAAISKEWDNKLYKDQYTGLKKICGDLSLIKNFKKTHHIYIRMHPNLKNITNQIAKSIISLENNYNFVTVIKPEDKIDSYTLLRKSDIIVTFGSTMGIEAIYWKKPSILLAPSTYYNLNCCYIPKTHKDVINILKSDKILTPSKRQRMAAIKYGFYASNFGINYKYINIESESKIFYANKEIMRALPFDYYIYLLVIRIVKKVTPKTILSFLKVFFNL